MDTQGLFDPQTSKEAMAIIGTLSFLLSSLQCFNVKFLIDEVHLDHIFVSALTSLHNIKTVWKMFAV